LPKNKKKIQKSPSSIQKSISDVERLEREPLSARNLNSLTQRSSTPTPQYLIDLERESIKSKQKVSIDFDEKLLERMYIIIILFFSFYFLVYY
jgi:hypothetical protein